MAKVELVSLDRRYCFIRFRHAWARSRDAGLERGQVAQSRPHRVNLLVSVWAYTLGVTGNSRLSGVTKGRSRITQNNCYNKSSQYTV
jgi:hypothetical protein